MKYPKILERIIEFATYEDNWDSYGSKKFTTSQLGRALDVYYVICRLTSNADAKKLKMYVFPNSDSCVTTLLFEANYGTRELEIYVPEVGKSLEYLKWISEEDNEEDSCSEEKLPELIEWLLQDG